MALQGERGVLQHGLIRLSCIARKFKVIVMMVTILIISVKILITALIMIITFGIY